MERRIFHIKEELFNNLQHQWKIEEMAEIVGLSAPHFQKLFKINIGMSPIEYLRDLRLERARELLETTFLQIQEIKTKVGIQNDSHFTRDFKKKYGVTPTEYRKFHSEEIQPENQDGKK